MQYEVEFMRREDEDKDFQYFNNVEATSPEAAKDAVVGSLKAMHGWTWWDRVIVTDNITNKQTHL